MSDSLLSPSLPPPSPYNYSVYSPLSPSPFNDNPKSATVNGTGTGTASVNDNLPSSHFIPSFDPTRMPPPVGQHFVFPGWPNIKWASVDMRILVIEGAEILFRCQFPEFCSFTRSQEAIEKIFQNQSFSNRHQFPLFQTDRRLPLWLLLRLRLSLPWTSCWPLTTACPTSPRRPPSLWWLLPLPVATEPFPPVWTTRQSSARTPSTPCGPLSEKIPVSVRVVSALLLSYSNSTPNSKFKWIWILNPRISEVSSWNGNFSHLHFYCYLFEKSIWIWTIQGYYIDQ